MNTFSARRGARLRRGPHPRHIQDTTERVPLYIDLSNFPFTYFFREEGRPPKLLLRDNITLYNGFRRASKREVVLGRGRNIAGGRFSKRADLERGSDCKDLSTFVIISWMSDLSERQRTGLGGDPNSKLDIVPACRAFHIYNEAAGVRHRQPTRLNARASGQLQVNQRIRLFYFRWLGLGQPKNLILRISRNAVTTAWYSGRRS